MNEAETCAELIESDIFRFILALPALEQAGEMLVEVPAETSGKTSGKIVVAIRKNPSITIPELSRFVGVTERSIERNLQKLQENGRIRRVGPAKGGPWVVIE
ncbi:winged helix-turn-helix domain-containing protein [Desulfuromonas acetexigens]|uniref:Winged helix-turn-helix transcriptional regulator n=1 Tax=Trichloromonas acetexigens TaxID=38815 RepID=A0A550JFE6_9BACT|nr:winged helix-turn-helix transcriptional regulator [Desulfuromonas acetexigens]TRO81922.1 winged helix-turn-helix transcriptional regulator [Desulfuromonas acetexigens]